MSNLEFVGLAVQTVGAGLLSAIQQFARDSFQSGKTENLGNMTFDELQIRVVSGPNAVIAAAIRMIQKCE